VPLFSVEEPNTTFRIYLACAHVILWSLFLLLIYCVVVSVNSEIESQQDLLPEKDAQGALRRFVGGASWQNVRSPFQGALQQVPRK
jgi:hypothetical protein